MKGRLIINFRLENDIVMIIILTFSGKCVDLEDGKRLLSVADWLLDSGEKTDRISEISLYKIKR